MSLNISSQYPKKVMPEEVTSNVTTPLEKNSNELLFDVSSNQNINYDTYTNSNSNANSNTTDGCDDGKISFGEGIKSFFKGLISPITNMFSSPKNFLIGAAMMVGGALLITATGGAAAPVLVAAGAAMGGIQVAKGAIGAATAKTDNEAKEAWENVGSGAGIVAMSIAGAKSSLKAAGVNTEGLNPLTATAKCFTTAPKNISNSIGAFTQGKALTNIKNTIGIKKSANTTTKEPKPTTEIEPAIENEVQTQPKVKVEQSKVENIQPKKTYEVPDVKIQRETQPFAQDDFSNSPLQKMFDRELELQSGGTKSRPLKGESLDLSTSKNTQSIKFTTQGKDGLYSEHTLVLDSDPNISENISAIAANRSDDLTLGLYSREAQFAPNHQISQSSYNKIATRYNLQGEELDNFVANLTDPSKIKSTQLENLAKSDLPATTSEHFLYRGVNLQDNESFGKIFLNAKKGDVITPDWGVSCTTPDASYALNYTGVGGQHLLKINVPKGSRISGTYNWQGRIEFHMPAMSQYKYLGNSTVGGATIHELEYIMPNLSAYV